jgi:hypothetical protein
METSNKLHILNAIQWNRVVNEWALCLFFWDNDVITWILRSLKVISIAWLTVNVRCWVILTIRVRKWWVSAKITESSSVWRTTTAYWIRWWEIEIRVETWSMVVACVWGAFRRI